MPMSRKNRTAPGSRVFLKRVDRATDPDGIIDGHFNVVKELDYECELAVIIGKEARNVEEKRCCRLRIRLYHHQRCNGP